ncbi:hypothetical protein SO802_012076 [Lithocarpus litseifolius]|uniref:Movement protein n=1 Tax=Lithocarpus litseifolius TaxID=425828 RepID=A0AAW2D1S2_9ROSI
MSDRDLKLGDWNLPKVPTKEFYKSFSWNLNSFKTDFHVRTIEQVYGINKEYETCYLFNPAQIKAHLKKGHHFLHIGLVQVGVKPLIRSGLNNSVLLALRDTRHIRFNDSLLGTVQASLSNGPVHFDCFPNFTVHLHDKNVMQALTLNIKTHGTFMTQGTSQIALIYRVYYKCIKTNMNVGALDRKKVGETLLIQTNIHAKVQIPRTLRWDEISFPEDWKLHNENHPLLIQEPDQDLELDFVQQLADGSVRLSFDKSRFRSPLDDYRPRSSIDLSRFPSRQPPILLKDRPVSQATKQDSVVDQDDNNNPKVGSPSGTDMEDLYQDNIEDYELKVLKKDFEPDMVYLGKEFDLEENRVKREAYRANHTKEQKKEVKVLSKQEELLLDLIEQIEDPIVKAQRLSSFHATLVKEHIKSEPKIREPKVDLEKIYDRFSRAKKEVTVNDLQKEIKDTKSEVRTLKQEMTILRVNNSLLDKRVKTLEEHSHQESE